MVGPGLPTALTLNAVVVEVQVFQLVVDGRYIADLVVCQVEHQQVGDVEGVLGEPSVGQLVVVHADESEVGEVLEIVFGDGLDLVAVQVELVNDRGHLGRHLSQDVVGQIELHEVLEALEGVGLEDAVAQSIVLQIQEEQVLELTEYTGWNPGDVVLAQSQLFQVPGQS